MGIEYFGERIKALRDSRSLSQQQLADRLCSTRATVSAYERGRLYPSVEKIYAICKLFDVSADFLLGISDHSEISMYRLSATQRELVLRLILDLEQENEKLELD
ncbi:MAG: helix-turn-helix domain-containing protein [Streptococcaceae bacterium]|nr:helix-turn-helix domain-containing protein [Streptococcaceae bacterium]